MKVLITGGGEKPEVAVIHRELDGLRGEIESERSIAEGTGESTPPYAVKPVGCQQ
jgi:hypothetical protein